MCGIRFHKKFKSQIFHSEKQQLFSSFLSISGRGPDFSSFMQPKENIILGFHRLAIMDTSPSGNQPFIFLVGEKTVTLLCNGEIYNHKELIRQYGLNPSSHSDCEVIGLLYTKIGFTKTIQALRGEFACIIYELDGEKQTIYAARDRIGVRPLFYSHTDNGIYFSSELKGIPDMNIYSDQLSPGTILTVHDDNSVTQERYFDIDILETYSTISSEKIAMEKIQKSLSEAVRKRLMSDRPLGCLLSGGLDSSLIVGIASSLLAKNQKLHTFTIGLERGTDLPYAKKVADHTGVEHHIITLSTIEALQVIRETIYAIESYDITTVRASIRQYLLGKHISEHYDIKVLLCGELSDELFSGYKYFHNAPSSEAMNKENIRLVKDVHRYDGLRTDRTMASHGLEVRLPFADEDFIETVFFLDPELRTPKQSHEKYILRKSFDNSGLIPQEVLRRSKEAFSDGVSSKTKSWFELLQDHIDTLISNQEFEQISKTISFNQPKTKEAYYYRKIFHEFFGEMNSHVIPYFRLPKRSGELHEPSARILKNYQ